jgi:hypothetical protein
MLKLFKTKPNTAFPVTALLLILAGWFPLLLKSGQVPETGDWHMFLQFYEAARIDILDYGQFPFWNPWHYGGTPLFARPQVGIFSIEMLFTLFFGTLPGIPLAMVAYAMIGALGMWFLLGNYVKTPLARFWGMLLFGLQGTLSIHIATGHIVMSPIAWLPWLVFWGLAAPRSLRATLLFGTTLALMLNQTIHYLSLIICATIAVFIFVSLIRAENRSKAIRNMFGAFLVFGALASFRLWTTWELVKHFQRIMPGRITLHPLDFLLGLVWPGQDARSFFPAPLPGYWTWEEMGCYIGICAILLFAWSFYKELRWWHWGFVLTFPLVIDSALFYLPGYWVRELPGFRSMFVITRWRFAAVFFLITGAARGMDLLFKNLEQRGSRRGTITITAILVVSLSGLLYTQWYNWMHLKVQPEAALLEKIPYRGNPIISSHDLRLNRYAATRKGVVTIFSYDPLLGYDLKTRCKSLRMSPESKFYKGEIWSLEGVPLKTLWTPNHITVSAPRDCTVLINQNPGSGWRLGNTQLFPEMRPFESFQPFAIRVKGGQSYTLSAKTTGYETGLVLNALFVIVLLLFLYKYKKELFQIST